MLRLTNITKDYDTGENAVHALKGITVSFRESEFVSILGPSGCGKTTLLNIIGGLDRYTSGDMTIGGVSTADYRDADWDAYRNHSVGFVFQSYNLIPHQTVLANVELALTLSGVGKAERRRRAIAALEQVGLGDQLKKKPNQMSGGQMQRVAIARALVNDPEILLADEPTGALDSETSLQVMELLREVARDRLVIMVTHNPELAETYSTRIIRVLDGRVLSDTDPYEPVDNAPQKVVDHKKSHTSMSFFTAMGLSLNNLMTKKGRTFLTAFAGSIGIIGIALILSLSSGVQNYINDVQEETLSSYPVTIYAEETDMSGLMASMMGVGEEASQASHEKDAVYSNPVMYDLMNTMFSAEKKTNNLTDFKVFLDDMENNGLSEYVSYVQYSYDLSLNVYARDENGTWSKSDPLALWENMMGEDSVYSGISDLYSSYSTLTCWKELMNDGTGLVAADERETYELLYGAWPQSWDEIVLIVSDNNEISDLILYCLGLTTREEMMNVMTSALQQKEIESTTLCWSYEEICDLDLRLLLPTDYYVQTESGWEDISDNETLLSMAVADAPRLKITGIVRSAEGDASQSGVLAYTSALTEYVITQTNASEIVQEQLLPENEDFDVIAGLPFEEEETDLTDAQAAAELREYLLSQDETDRALTYLDLASRPQEDAVEEALEAMLAQYPDRESLEELVVSSYAEQTGMSEEVIREYLASSTDEELTEMITQGAREQIIAQFAESARQELITRAAQAAGLDSASEEALAAGAEMAAQQVLAQTTKQEYIIGQYLSATAMDAATIYAWVMSLDQAALDAEFDRLMTELAAGYMGETASVSEEELYPTLAPMLEELLDTFSDTELAALYDELMPARSSGGSLAENLRALGVLDLASPSEINIYTTTFASKDAIAEIIDDYNADRDEEDRITYTDYVALLMSSVTRVINAISYVLVAFVSISLVVSSIMIGIITYISVLERTKEIGILRAVGAAKKDVGRVFNAETLIVGFTAGVIGIGVTLLLNIPINAIIMALTDIENLRAVLPWQGGLTLVLISMALTVISGLIPSGCAARKDPVEALRTE